MTQPIPHAGSHSVAADVSPLHSATGDPHFNQSEPTQCVGCYWLKLVDNGRTPRPPLCPDLKASLCSQTRKLNREQNFISPQFLCSLCSLWLKPFGSGLMHRQLHFAVSLRCGLLGNFTVSRQGQQRPGVAIHVVLQVENFRETRARRFVLAPENRPGFWVRHRYSMPRMRAGFSGSSNAHRPITAHAVCDAVLGPCPLNTGSSYVLQRSPQPPSSCWTLSSHAPPRRSQSSFMFRFSARMPRNTCQVP